MVTVLRVHSDRLRILIVTATTLEIAPFRAALRGDRDHAVDVLETGVGMVAMAARCARALALGHYDLALNLGLCGSFDAALPPGTVVHVVADRIAELGAEDGDAFLTLGALDLGSDDEIVNAAPPASAALDGLPAVHGITVNTVHGHERSIAEVTRRLAPQVESMEGAGFMYACVINGVPFAQVRAVSNVVERRNRQAWKIPEAIRNLGAAAEDILRTLNG